MLFFIQLFVFLAIAMPSLDVHAQPREDRAGFGVSVQSENRVRGRTLYEGLGGTIQGEYSWAIGKRSTILLDGGVLLPLQGERNNEEPFLAIPRLIYQTKSGPGLISLGAQSFLFAGSSEPVSAGDTTELLMALEFSSVTKPTIRFFQDIDESHARYLELGIRHDIVPDYYEKQTVISPFITMGYGYNTSEREYANDGRNHIEYGVRAKKEINECSTIGATFSYFESSDRGVQDGARFMISTEWRS
jgi:hypothetical protein